MLIEAHLSVAQRVCVMGGIVVLLCTGAARASGIAVTVTQIGSDAEEIGRGYIAACGAGACRLALPVTVGGVNGVRCVLDVRVTEADAHGAGEIMVSVGACETRIRLAVAPDASVARYQLDENGAEAKSLSLPFIPNSDFGGGQPATAMNDGVWRSSATIRVDIVARGHAP